MNPWHVAWLQYRTRQRNGQLFFLWFFYHISQGLIARKGTLLSPRSKCQNSRDTRGIYFCVKVAGVRVLVPMTKLVEIHSVHSAGEMGLNWRSHKEWYSMGPRCLNVIECTQGGLWDLLPGYQVSKWTKTLFLSYRAVNTLGSAVNIPETAHIFLPQQALHYDLSWSPSWIPTCFSVFCICQNNKSISLAFH